MPIFCSQEDDFNSEQAPPPEDDMSTVMMMMVDSDVCYGDGATLLVLSVHINN